MREIKFRYVYRRINDGKLWVLMASLDGFENGGDNERMITGSMRGNSEWELIARDQYAGLKDKNGKEIFEGDVVVYKNERYIVKYFNRVGSFRLYPIFLNNESHNGSLSWSKRFRDSVSFSSLYEIIGNIHEHPELLK